jgi:hypothetical protein
MSQPLDMADSYRYDEYMIRASQHRATFQLWSDVTERGYDTWNAEFQKLKQVTMVATKLVMYKVQFSRKCIKLDGR